jgi:hypothetical protein
MIYFLTTFLESGLSVFGIRAGYEQPAYRVVEVIPPDIEIRAYAPRSAVETAIADGRQGAAFGRLFAYITGANAARQTVSMTVPVAQTAQLIAMTVPVELSGENGTMRFFLPQAVVRAGAPVPTDPQVHVVALPAETLAVIRYSGLASPAIRAAELGRLSVALRAANKSPAGAPVYLSYDPPFALPFLRRNEVALPISP